MASSTSPHSQLEAIMDEIGPGDISPSEARAMVDILTPAVKRFRAFESGNVVRLHVVK
jgi:hypothetical protein